MREKRMALLGNTYMKNERLFLQQLAWTIIPCLISACSTSTDPEIYPGSAYELQAFTVGQVLPLRVSQIMAGQPAVGKDQIAYKTGRFDGVYWPSDVPPSLNGDLKPGHWYSIDQKMFEDVAESNGQVARNDQTDNYGEVYEVAVDRKTADGKDANPGDPNHPSTFYSVRFKSGSGGKLDGKIISPGNDRDSMKTVVRGPDKNFYLTDGHHTTLAFSEMKHGRNHGKRHGEFTYYLVLDKDYSRLEDSNNSGSAMDEFWVKAANDGQVWLKKLRKAKPGYAYLPGVEGSPNTYQVTSVDLKRFQGSLPTEMKLREFADDPYRGILYFCRDIGWNKPERGPGKNLPFLEFYWAEHIQTAIESGEHQLDLHTKESIYNLSDLKSYTEAVHAISLWMSTLKSDTIIGSSDLTAQQMGQIPYDNNEFGKEFALLIDASETKDGESKNTLEPEDSDEPEAKEIGVLPKPGKWAWSWAQRNATLISKFRRKWARKSRNNIIH